MTITISSRQILNLLNILAWIIFFGVSFEAGAIIVSTVISLTFNPAFATNGWSGNDLSHLLAFDRGHFIAQSITMAIVGIARATIFYLIIKLLHEKKLDMDQPFSRPVGRFIFNLSYLAMLTGFFSSMGARYRDHMIKQGVIMPDLQNMRLGGADVWWFMGITLIVIGYIFKRGIEIQSENELTV